MGQTIMFDINKNFTVQYENFNEDYGISLKNDYINKEDLSEYNEHERLMLYWILYENGEKIQKLSNQFNVLDDIDKRFSSIALSNDEISFIKGSIMRQVEYNEKFDLDNESINLKIQTYFLNNLPSLILDLDGKKIKPIENKKFTYNDAPTVYEVIFKNGKPNSLTESTNSKIRKKIIFDVNGNLDVVKTFDQNGTLESTTFFKTQTRSFKTIKQYFSNGKIFGKSIFDSNKYHKDYLEEIIFDKKGDTLSYQLIDNRTAESYIIRKSTSKNLECKKNVCKWKWHTIDVRIRK